MFGMVNDCDSGFWIFFLGGEGMEMGWVEGYKLRRMRAQFCKR